MQKPIRDKIKTKLDSINDIKETFYVEPARFSQSPSAVVAMSQTESEYGATDRRHLTYNFQIRIYYDTESSQKTNEEIEILLMELHDKVLEEFSDSDSLSPEAFGVLPIPTTWSVIPGQEGTHRVARLDLRATYNMETNN